MAKTSGTYPMTPIEDSLAYALVCSGRSYRETARLLGRTGKSIEKAVGRYESNGEIHPLLELLSKKALLDALSGADRKLLANVRGFARWLAEGESNGWVAALVRLLTTE